MSTRRKALLPRIDPGRFMEHVKSGATIVLDCVNEVDERVDGFTRFLEREFGSIIQGNLYGTLTSHEAFGIHWDGHDVIVMQIRGSKTWEIHKPNRLHPLDKDVDSEAAPKGEPYASVKLMAGDVLYVPRGWWHRVISESESLHITFGFSKKPMVEIVNILQEKMCDDSDFRKDFPSHVNGNHEAAHLAFSEAKRKLVELVEGLTLQEAWHYMDSTRKDRVDVQVSSLASKSKNLVQRNWRVTPFVSEDSGSYKFSFLGKTFRSKLNLRKMVDILNSAESIEIDTLHGKLSEDSPVRRESFLDFMAKMQESGVVKLT